MSVSGTVSEVGCTRHMQMWVQASQAGGHGDLKQGPGLHVRTLLQTGLRR